VGIACTYYSITTLSTVGFGDYNPKSNFERLVCSVIMLFGVSIFSYIMGNFLIVSEKFKDFNKSLDEGEILDKFFLTLRKFNRNEPLNLEFQKEIERYFSYRWENDLN